ncbi:MAG: alpha/beta hydrolase [Bergeyella sp.]
MKLYMVSGLGADYKVLEKLEFNSGIEVSFLDWKIPERNEKFSHYIERMAGDVDDSAPFHLLGYSFGGIVAQEINLRKKAEKTVILGSIKSHKEKSRLIKAGELTHLPKYLPEKIFNEKSAVAYGFFRKLFDPKNPKVMEYFRVRNPYYLKWSIEKISEWKFEENPDVIQILGDRDIVFPVKNSRPDYVIKGGTHLFPATRPKEVSKILQQIFI